MKKTLMIAAAALTLTAGAAAFNATPAQAGKFNIGIHFGGHGHGYGHGFYGHNYGGCFTKYKKVKIKVWGPYGWHWKWIKKPYTYCY